MQERRWLLGDALNFFLVVGGCGAPVVGGRCSCVGRVVWRGGVAPLVAGVWVGARAGTQKELHILRVRGGGLSLFCTPIVISPLLLKLFGTPKGTVKFRWHKKNYFAVCISSSNMPNLALLFASKSLKHLLWALYCLVIFSPLNRLILALRLVIFLHKFFFFLFI